MSASKHWVSLGRRHKSGAYEFKMWLKSNPLVLVTFTLPKKLPAPELFEQEHVELQLSAPGLLVRSANLARIMLGVRAKGANVSALKLWPHFESIGEQLAATFHCGPVVGGPFTFNQLAPVHLLTKPKVKALCHTDRDGRPYYTFEFSSAIHPGDYTFFT